MLIEDGGRYSVTFQALSPSLYKILLTITKLTPEDSGHLKLMLDDGSITATAECFLNVKSKCFLFHDIPNRHFWNSQMESAGRDLKESQNAS